MFVVSNLSFEHVSLNEMKNDHIINIFHSVLIIYLQVYFYCEEEIYKQSGMNIVQSAFGKLIGHIQRVHFYHVFICILSSKELIVILSRINCHVHQILWRIRIVM